MRRHSTCSIRGLFLMWTEFICEHTHSLEISARWRNYLFESARMFSENSDRFDRAWWTIVFFLVYCSYWCMNRLAFVERDLERMLSLIESYTNFMYVCMPFMYSTSVFFKFVISCCLPMCALLWMSYVRKCFNFAISSVSAAIGALGGSQTDEFTNRETCRRASLSIII